MKKYLIITLFVCLLFIVSGCSGASALSKAEGRAPTPAATLANQATAGPAEPTQVSPPALEGNAIYRSTSGCDLLDSRDVTSLFSSAEVEGPVYKVSQVNHLVFSTKSISATESSCIYYVYHKPGSKDMKLLQVTYWLDIPDPATSNAWAQVSADAQSKTAQAIPGIGDGAFYNNGRLTFKKGSTYVTIEIVGTSLNTDTSAGMNQQIEMEKQIALKALSRLGS